MRWTWIAAFGVGATLALAACAQQHASPCPQLAEVLAAQDMYQTRSCARWAACHRDGSFADGPEGCWSVSPDEALCDELASGTVVFHPERAAECAAALAACEAEPCFQRIPSPAPFYLLPRRCALDACDQMIERLPGAPCAWICPHGQNCITSDDGCGGVCTLAGGIGAPCSDRVACADHLRCRGGVCTDACAAASDCSGISAGDEVATCDAGRCTFAPRPHLGEPCVALFDCSFFEDSYCNASTHVCTARVAGGEPCDPNGGPYTCASFLTCDATSTCTGTGNCTPFGGCYDDTPYCMPGERTCTGDPTMQECDVPIVTGSGYETCPEGTACVGTERTESLRGTCLPIAPLGASCDASVSCTPGSRCAAGTCRRVVPPGATCDPSVSCGEYQACVDGVCASDGYRWIGASCTSDAQCVTGRCDGGVCVWLAQGEPCDPTTSYPIPCEFGCFDDGSGHATCRAGVDHLGVGASCDYTHQCDDSLVCLPRVDGTTVCRPRCAS